MMSGPVSLCLHYSDPKLTVQLWRCKSSKWHNWGSALQVVEYHEQLFPHALSLRKRAGFVERMSEKPRVVACTASHQAMLKATLELLSEVGFEAMSIEAIATRAGVGKTTIYRRYSRKNELVADAIESSQIT